MGDFLPVDLPIWQEVRIKKQFMGDVFFMWTCRVAKSIKLKKNSGDSLCHLLEYIPVGKYGYVRFVVDLWTCQFCKRKKAIKKQGRCFFSLTWKITQSAHADMVVFLWTCGLANFPKIKKLKKQGGQTMIFLSRKSRVKLTKTAI